MPAAHRGEIFLTGKRRVCSNQSRCPVVTVSSHPAGRVFPAAPACVRCGHTKKNPFALSDFPPKSPRSRRAGGRREVPGARRLVSFGESGLGPTAVNADSGPQVRAGPAFNVMRVEFAVFLLERVEQAAYLCPRGAPLSRPGVIEGTQRSCRPARATVFGPDFCVRGRPAGCRLSGSSKKRF